MLEEYDWVDQAEWAAKVADGTYTEEQARTLMNMQAFTGSIIALGIPEGDVDVLHRVQAFPYMLLYYAVNQEDGTEWYLWQDEEMVFPLCGFRNSGSGMVGKDSFVGVMFTTSRVFIFDSFPPPEAKVMADAVVNSDVDPDHGFIVQQYPLDTIQRIKYCKPAAEAPYGILELKFDIPEHLRLLIDNLISHACDSKANELRQKLLARTIDVSIVLQTEGMAEAVSVCWDDVFGTLQKISGCTLIKEEK